MDHPIVALIYSLVVFLVHPSPLRVNSSGRRMSGTFSRKPFDLAEGPLLRVTLLRQRGRVAHRLEEGVWEWRARGLPVVTGDEPSAPPTRRAKR